MQTEIILSRAQLPEKFEDLQRFVLIGREKLVAVRAEIRAMEKLNIATGVREQKKEEAQTLASVLLDAEVRIGELLKEIPKDNNFRGNQYLECQSNTGVTLPNTKEQILKQGGYTKMQASRYETLAENPEIVEKVKHEALANDELPTRSEVLRRVKINNRKNKIENQKEKIKNLEKPTGLFDVIVVDPPWEFQGEYDPVFSRRVGDYPTMPLEKIKEIVLPAKKDCVLWLWITNNMIKEGFEVLEAWGFTYRNILTWDKEIMGVGSWLRNQTEHCLMATRGQPIIELRNQTTIIREKRTKHSAKPESFYQMINSLCIGEKLDYFARKERNGFTCYGDEI